MTGYGEWKVIHIRDVDSEVVFFWIEGSGSIDGVFDIDDRYYRL